MRISQKDKISEEFFIVKDFGDKPKYKLMIAKIFPILTLFFLIFHILFLPWLEVIHTLFFIRNSGKHSIIVIHQR